MSPSTSKAPTTLTATLRAKPEPPEGSELALGAAELPDGDANPVSTPIVEAEAPVVSVVSEPRSTPSSSEIRASSGGTLGLCPPAETAVVSVVFPPDPTALDRWADDGGAAGTDRDDVQTGAVEASAETDAGTAGTVAEDFPETLRLLALVGTDHDPYKEGGPWAYADAEDLGGRVFFVTQNLVYAPTGQKLLTQERIEKAVSKKGMTRWGWIKHDKDTYTAEEAKKIPGAAAGKRKADHFHVAIERKSFATLGVIARAFGVPPNAVEIKPQGSFLDLIEYLTHEHPNQVNKGKHLYDDSEVHANFDWRPALDEHKLARSAKAGQRASLKKRDAIREAVMLGEMTLKQVREGERAIYIQDLDKLQKLRQDFMLHQPAPRRRTNYYIGSPAGAVRKGRTGKTQLAKLFARMLYPGLDADECYHVATDARVPLQNYKGQPVIIWDDYSVPGLLAALGSREGVWQVFDDHPSASDANIKYGSVRLVHAVNIIAKTTPYAEYLDGLAGEYTDAAGNTHEAEDRNQSWGRFPIVFEVTTHSIEMLLNQGFVNDTDDFLAYQKVARMRASMKQVCGALDSIECDEEREAATFQIGEVLLRPIIDQHHALQPIANRGGAEVVGELLADIEVHGAEVLAAEEAEAAGAAEAAAEAKRAALVRHGVIFDMPVGVSHQGLIKEITAASPPAPANTCSSHEDIDREMRRQDREDARMWAEIGALS